MQRQNAQKPDDGPVHLTEAGILRMQRRLVELKASLPERIADAAEAAAQGDRSENDAYKQSKSLLRRTHRQIWAIEDQLKRVVVIKAGRNAEGTVQIGSRVTLASREKDRTTFEIVGSRETNPGRGYISHVSPLGAALLGHREGDVVTIKTAVGTRTYEILEVQ